MRKRTSHPNKLFQEEPQRIGTVFNFENRSSDHTGWEANRNCKNNNWTFKIVICNLDGAFTA